MELNGGLKLPFGTDWAGGHLKARARRPAAEASVRPPTSVTLNGTEVTLWTYDVLASLNRANLKQRAIFLRDAFGADNLPPLLSAAAAEDVARWMIHAQVTVVRESGGSLTANDLGLRADNEPTAHQVRESELIRLEAAGIVVPNANLGGETAAQTTATPTSSVDPRYDWAHHESISERTYGRKTAAESSAVYLDGVQRGLVSKARNQARPRRRLCISVVIEFALRPPSLSTPPCLRGLK